MQVIRAAAVAVVLGLLCFRPVVAGAGDEKDPFPGKATLAAYDAKRPFLRNFLLPAGRADSADPACRIARGVAGANLVFTDLDGNGRFDDAGADGWAVEGNAHLVPFETPLIVGAKEVRVPFAPDSTELRFRTAAIPGPPESLEVLAVVNGLRLRNGIPPVTLDPALSRACELHSEYCRRNGLTHDELPGKPGYTEEGARAGKASSVTATRSPVDAVAGFYCDFHHRFSIVDPRTRALGIGVSVQVTSIDGSSSTASRPWRWPQAIPAHATGGQPREFGPRESPRAFPDALTPGFPITLLFSGTDVREVKASLFSGARGTTPIPFLVSWPGNPAHPDFPDNCSAIAIIPEERLSPETAYSWRITFLKGGKPGEAAGEFVTGRSGGAR